ncbi:hypothetical protein [Vasconcelosia minhoensis]|uniref:hypothetical protein n=1 Tax=Vasconcelosia minhoensis TaxID=3366354 RepID=UPI0022409869|nr:hypothetical protein [Romeria gracilis]
MSPVHFWQGQTQAQIGSQNGARMTGLAAFALDFEGEWEERLAQLAEKLPDLKCYIPER